MKKEKKHKFYFKGELFCYIAKTYIWFYHSCLTFNLVNFLMCNLKNTDFMFESLDRIG